jgi:hypothetical protein
VSLTTTTGTALSLSNIAGTLNFTGVSTSGGAGVSLTGSNSSATFSFSGIAISSGANAGFSATGGGTVNVTGSTNTITTTTGAALNVVSTNIGASGMTFLSISAGTSSTGPANAIVLNGTGSSGGLTVTGDGSSSRNGSGGTIQHTTSDSVLLTSTTNVALQRMNINNSSANGIFGTNGVNGFILDWASMSTNGTAANQGALRFGDQLNPSTGLTGLGPGSANPTRISNSVLSASFERNVSMFSSSGLLTELDVQNSTFQTAKNGSGFLIETRSTAVATVIVTGSTFSSNFSVGIQGSALSASNLTLKILGATSANTFSSNNDGVLCSNDDNAKATCQISNNTFTGQPGNAIFVGNGTQLTDTGGVLNARIESNTITQPSTGNNNPIGVFLSGNTTTSNVLLNLNTITTAGTSDGIFVDTPDSNSTPHMNVTVTNNTVSVTDSVNGANAIDLQPHQSATACFNVTGNFATTAASIQGLDGIFMFQSGSATVTLDKGSSSSTTATGVLTDNNPGSTPISAIGAITLVTTTCATPP